MVSEPLVSLERVGGALVSLAPPHASRRAAADGSVTARIPRRCIIWRRVSRLSGQPANGSFLLLGSSWLMLVSLAVVHSRFGRHLQTGDRSHMRMVDFPDRFVKKKV